jgi:hypothetical protein
MRGKRRRTTYHRHTIRVGDDGPFLKKFEISDRHHFWRKCTRPSTAYSGGTEFLNWFVFLLFLLCVVCRFSLVWWVDDGCRCLVNGTDGRQVDQLSSPSSLPCHTRTETLKLLSSGVRQGVCVATTTAHPSWTDIITPELKNPHSCASSSSIRSEA